MERPEGSEASDIEARAALETFWGKNWYAQVEFLNCHVLNEEEMKSGTAEYAELRFDFIKPDDKPMVAVWDNLEECLFVDPAPIPMPLYRPRFGADYPRSVGHRVQFSLNEFGKPFDNNYIYSTPRILEMKGKKMRVFRHNVNRFEDKLGGDVKVLHDFRQIISFIMGQEKQRPGYTVGSFMKECIKLIDINIKKELPWTDEMMSKFLLYSVVQETAMSQMGEGYTFNAVHHNSRYQIMIHNDRPISLDIGLRLGPTVLGHYVGKYDKDYKYLVDAARFAFYKSSMEHGYLYINDGSDLGSAGLRQLKRKFHPVKVIDLYNFDPNGSAGGDTSTESPDTPPSNAIHTRGSSPDPSEGSENEKTA